MKRVFPILLIFVFVISLAVPALAYDFNGVELPMPPVEYDANVIWKDSSTGSSYFVTASADRFLYANDMYYLQGDNFSYRLYQLSSDSWNLMKSLTNVSAIQLHAISDIKTSNVVIVWHDTDMEDFVNSNGSVIPGTPIVRYCDGTTCPATDLDHNNICDDCGNVLAMSLRSPLLSYVKSVAEDYLSGYPYYAVFENSLGGLNLYISKAPITIDGNDYYHVVGTSGQWTRAFTDDTGVHSHDVFASWTSPVGGTLVYSNHEIENFQMPPLAVVIQGVTEGELMEVTVPNLAKVMKILVPCGVGCLALLIVLSLFGKRSLISRN